MICNLSLDGLRRDTGVFLKFFLNRGKNCKEATRKDYGLAKHDYLMKRHVTQGKSVTCRDYLRYHDVRSYISMWSGFLNSWLRL